MLKDQGKRQRRMPDRLQRAQQAETLPISHLLNLEFSTSIIWGLLIMPPLDSMPYLACVETSSQEE